MDIPEDLLEEVINIVKEISIALSKISDGISIAQNNKKVAGQLVPHLHFHLIPRYKDDGHKFKWSTEKYKENEAVEIASKIKSLL
jgi:histidine triad (HIT) family protein